MRRWIRKRIGALPQYTQLFHDAQTKAQHQEATPRHTYPTLFFNSSGVDVGNGLLQQSIKTPQPDFFDVERKTRQEESGMQCDDLTTQNKSACQKRIVRPHLESVAFSVPGLVRTLRHRVLRGVIGLRATIADISVLVLLFAVVSTFIVQDHVI